MAAPGAADLHQLCKVHFLPMPKDQISCLQNNAHADEMEKAAETLRVGNCHAGLGLLPGSARMSRRFDGKRLRRGIAAKRFKGILVVNSQGFQRTLGSQIPLKFRAPIYSFCETWAGVILKRADD